MLLAWALVTGACAGPAPAAGTFAVEDFGAVGDGVHDDGPALRAAVAAAVAAGAGSTVALGPKTYRLDAFDGGECQVALVGVEGLEIAGRDTRLVSHPRNGLIDIRDCHGVAVRGLAIDHDPLPFTQGTIRATDPAAGTLDVEIHAGYPLPPDHAELERLGGPKACEWGAVMDPVGRHRRWDVKDHFMIGTVAPLPGLPRQVRITLRGEQPDAVRPIADGDRFVLPLRHAAPGRHGIGANIAITASADVVVEDVRFASTRSGMTVLLARNVGALTLRRVGVDFPPGSDRLVTSWKDGVHCKGNRVGPTIEDCTFAGLLDDSINMGADTAMATEVLSPTEFRLTGRDFAAGDDVLVVDPAAGRVLAETRVAAVRDEAGGRVVVLAHPLDPAVVVTGRMRPHVDVAATHFYDTSRANRGFTVRGCTFLAQRRHALLVRASDGTIEGNTVDGVGGSAVWLGNEIGSYYEGPFPARVTVRGNVIRATQRPAIVIRTHALRGGQPLTGPIDVLDNDVTVLPGRPAVSISRAHDVRVAGNRIRDTGGAVPPRGGIEVSDSVNVTVEPTRD